MRKNIDSFITSTKFEINCRTVETEPNLQHYTWESLQNQLNSQKEQEKLQESKKKFKLKKINKPNKLISITKSYPSSNLYDNLKIKDDDKINIGKRVSEIRDKIRNNPNNNFGLNSNVYYSKDKAEFVFESSFLLSKLQKRKEYAFDDKYSSLSDFLLENKEISIKNLLIKLLRNENKKLENYESDMKKKLDDEKNEYENNFNNFQLLAEKQKNYCSEINQYLSLLEKKKNDHLNEVRDLKCIGKEIEESMEKVIFNINNYREYALFINETLERKNPKFEKSVIPTESKFKYNESVGKPKNYCELLTSNVLKNYSNFLEDDFDEDPILQHPDKFVQKYNDLEHKILRMLDEYKKTNDSIDKDSLAHKKELSNLEERLLEKQRDFDNINNEYKKLLAEFNSVRDINKNWNNIYNTNIDYIKDIYQSFVYDDYDKNFKGDTCEVIKNTMNVIRKTEDKLNTQLATLEVYEKDTALFYEIVNYRKNALKDDKLTAAAKIQEEIQNRKKIDAEKRFNKIIFINKKVNIPFRTEKKEKISKIDEEEIKNAENNQFIKY